MRYQTVAKLFALTYGIKIGQQLAGRAAQDASGQSLISVGGIKETSIMTSLFLIMNHADLLQEDEQFWWKVFVLLGVWETSGLPKWVRGRRR